MKRYKAIALGYKFGEKAPKILAKGEALKAEKIVEIAKKYDIPIKEDPQAAEMLYNFPIDEYLPEELYQILAEILAWAYRIKKTT